MSIIEIREIDRTVIFWIQPDDTICLDGNSYGKFIDSVKHVYGSVSAEVITATMIQSIVR